MEEKSRELLTSGKLRKVEVENLKMQYEGQLKYADFLRLNLAELGQNITSIATGLSDMNTTNGECDASQSFVMFSYSCHIKHIFILDKIEFIHDVLTKNKSAIDIKDDVYDSIFNIQDKITDGLKPKLRSVQGYGEIGLRPNDELQGSYPCPRPIPTPFKNSVRKVTSSICLHTQFERLRRLPQR